MVQFNVAAREINIKVVYYGPALSGKTTNLQMIHKLMNPDQRGRLMSLDTKDDRTLFFDLLPVQFKTKSGYSIKLKLFTVPGQVIHNSTRRVVLQAADGVAFIADSQEEQSKNNAESFRNLQENLSQNNLDPNDFPIVVQYNKRDLPNVKSPEDITEAWKDTGTPIYLASAMTGDGVVETFVRLVELTFQNLNRKQKLEEKFGLDTKEFLSSLLATFGREGSSAPPGIC
jgi:signal recognition particle receptor subunit beta